MRPTVSKPSTDHDGNGQTLLTLHLQVTDPVFHITLAIQWGQIRDQPLQQTGTLKSGRAEDQLPGSGEAGDGGEAAETSTGGRRPVYEAFIPGKSTGIER